MKACGVLLNPTYLSASSLFLLILCSVITPKADSREITEEDVRKAGIVPARKALELLKTSISNQRKRDDVMKLNFREARQNSHPDKATNIDELCAVSSSLICGNEVLQSLEFNKENSKTVHDRCTAREEFLECLGKSREKCRDRAAQNEMPHLPAESVIKDTQLKISQALWTSGGCLLG